MNKTSGQLTQTDTERERKTAKKITSCIMSVLRFWRLCRKKKVKANITKNDNKHESTLRSK